jgi:dihydropteroate synthase
MPFALRSAFDWKLRTQSLALGKQTLVMGILNVTPDSFSDGGRFLSLPAAVEHALAMIEEGAAIVDIGGESTKPGERMRLSPSEEIDRVLPVLEAVLQHRPGAILSVDTYRAATAEAALRSGAEVINDVSGLLWDGDMAKTCAAAGCGLVLMHTRGRPEEWRKSPRLSAERVVPLVREGLDRQLQDALAAGIARQHIVLDPGLGFGKAFEDNYPLLAGLEQLRSLGQPILIGASRKSFLGRTLARFYGGVAPSAELRGSASLAAATAAILGGADLLRAHEVRSTVEAAAIADAVLAAIEKNG